MHMVDARVVDRHEGADRRVSRLDEMRADAGDARKRRKQRDEKKQDTEEKLQGEASSGSGDGLDTQAAARQMPSPAISSASLPASSCALRSWG